MEHNAEDNFFAINLLAKESTLQGLFYMVIQVIHHDFIEIEYRA